MRGGRTPDDPCGHTLAPASQRAAITLRDVEVHRARTVALREVTFEVPAGTLTAVVGPNGAGKSSLFGLISGRLRATRGDVRVHGPVAEVMQSTRVDEQLPLTVDDVVRLGRYPARGLLGPMRGLDRRAIETALAAMDLLALRRRSINQLSGGQRQRALVAQGLAQQAPILLLDEPTAGLDLASKQQVVQVMRSEASAGTTVLFATHDLGEAAQADNVIVLACECVCCAPPVRALADPAVTALFGPGPLHTWSDDPTGGPAGDLQPAASPTSSIA